MTRLQQHTSAEAFEHAYAKRRGLTIERLRELGRVVVPCNCGDESCEGWASLPNNLDPFDVWLATRIGDPPPR